MHPNLRQMVSTLLHIFCHLNPFDLWGHPVFSQKQVVESDPKCPAFHPLNYGKRFTLCVSSNPPVSPFAPTTGVCWYALDWAVGSGQQPVKQFPPKAIRGQASSCSDGIPSVVSSEGFHTDSDIKRL